MTVTAYSKENAKIARLRAARDVHIGPAECVIGAAAQNPGPADVIDGPADGSNVGFQRCNGVARWYTCCP